MPTSAPETRPPQAVRLGVGTELPGPPPSATLLRAVGGARVPSPLEPADALVMLARDARLLLTVAGEDPVAVRWARPSFARRVEAVRAQLAPIDDARLLGWSFARESLHDAAAGRVPAVWMSPVRAAYALRWLELSTGLVLPTWRSWFP
jgi:hypothetical protein